MTRLARLAAALALLALAPGCIATTHMYPDPGPRRWNLSTTAPSALIPVRTAPSALAGDCSTGGFRSLNSDNA